jgi:hypothetical protein
VVQKKASNLAIKYELGTFPICFKALLSVFKYYKRLQNHDVENGINWKMITFTILAYRKIGRDY